MRKLLIIGLFLLLACQNNEKKLSLTEHQKEVIDLARKKPIAKITVLKYLNISVNADSGHYYRIARFSRYKNQYSLQIAYRRNKNIKWFTYAPICILDSSCTKVLETITD